MRFSSQLCCRQTHREDGGPSAVLPCLPGVQRRWAVRPHAPLLQHCREQAHHGQRHLRRGDERAARDLLQAGRVRQAGRECAEQGHYRRPGIEKYLPDRKSVRAGHLRYFLVF